MCNFHSLEGEEEAGGEQDEAEGQVEDPRLSRHHEPPVAVEPVPPREQLPLPAGAPGPLAGPTRLCPRAAVRGADLVVLTRMVLLVLVHMRHVSSQVSTHTGTGSLNTDGNVPKISELYRRVQLERSVSPKCSVSVLMNPHVGLLCLKYLNPKYSVFIL